MHKLGGKWKKVSRKFHEEAKLCQEEAKYLRMGKKDKYGVKCHQIGKTGKITSMKQKGIRRRHTWGGGLH